VGSKTLPGGGGEVGGDGEVVRGVGGEVVGVDFSVGGGEGRFSPSPRRADQSRGVREVVLGGFWAGPHKSGRAGGQISRADRCVRDFGADMFGGYIRRKDKKDQSG